MGSFDNGISSYVRGRWVVTQFWPVDARGNAEISCVQCFYYRDASKRCSLTGEVSQYPQKYVGGSCPLLNDEDFEKLINSIKEEKHDS